MSRYFAERSGAFDVTREDVERLRYLNNPRKAASYLGIPQAQVEDVWAEIPEHRDRGTSIGARESNGTNAAAQFSQKARIASERLRCELLRSMLRWADSNGTTIDHAARFLMSGTFSA